MYNVVISLVVVFLCLVFQCIENNGVTPYRRPGIWDMEPKTHWSNPASLWSQRLRYVLSIVRYVCPVRMCVCVCSPTIDTHTILIL